MTTGYEWARERTTAALRAEMTGLRRYANKRDASEPDIVEIFERCGATVQRFDKPFDLLVGYMGVTHIVECKTPGTAYGKKLGDGQQAWADAWRGSQVHVVRSVDDALELLNQWRTGLA